MLRSIPGSWTYPLAVYFGHAAGRFSVVLAACLAGIGLLLLRCRFQATGTWLRGLSRAWRLGVAGLGLALACDAGLAVSYFLRLLSPLDRGLGEICLQLAAAVAAMLAAILFLAVAGVALGPHRLPPGFGQALDTLPRPWRMAGAAICLLLALGVASSGGEVLGFLHAFQPKQLLFRPK
jgi:hypothetical protein